MFKDIIKSIKENPVLAILVSFIVILSDDCFWFSTYGNPIYQQLKLLFIVFLPFSFYVKGARLGKNDIYSIFAVILLVMVSGAINNSSLGGGLRLFFTLFSSMLFCKKIVLSKFCILFSNIILLLIVYSLSIWVLILFQVIAPVPITNIADVILDTYGGNIFIQGYAGSYRNSCIFREPGMFMVYICLSFLFEAFIIKRAISYKKIIIYALGILSTYSTARFLIFGVLLFIYLNTNFAKSFKKKIINYTLFLSMLILITTSEFILDNVFGKISSTGNTPSTRVASIFIPLDIIMDNFLFGVGTTNFDRAFMDKSLEIYNIRIDPKGHSTNTICNAGAIFGSWLFCFLIYGSYKFSSLASKVKLMRCVILLLICMMLSNENMVYSLIVYLMIFYGMDVKNITHDTIACNKGNI